MNSQTSRNPESEKDRSGGGQQAHAGRRPGPYRIVDFNNPPPRRFSGAAVAGVALLGFGIVVALGYFGLWVLLP